MWIVKILLLSLALIEINANLIKIPDNFKNAKDINEHPQMQNVLHEHFDEIHQETDNDNVDGKTPLIIGGNVANRGQIPHQVLIFIVRSPTSVYMCGGSLLYNYWVLTAAHCVYNSFTEIWLYFGVVNINEGAYWRAMVQKIDVAIHENYDPSYLTNDIAMIGIPWSEDRNEMLNNIYISPIALPTDYRLNDFYNMIGVASGFGRISDYSNKTSNELRFVDLPIIKNDDCKGYYREGLVRDSNICGRTSMTSGICNGDSGGPFTVEIDDTKIIIGISSFVAQSGCQSGYPAGFTRVTSYLNWIQNVMNGAPRKLVINGVLVVISQVILRMWKI